MAILPSQRHRFDLPADVAYLNCAYMSPMAHEVAAACHAGVDRKRRPWLVKPADFFSATEAARTAFAGLLGAPATPNDVALVPAASYGMAVAAANLPIGPGRRVLMIEAEFPSTILTWRDRARETGGDFHLVPHPADHDWTAALLAAIDERTAVAALPACHWIDGSLVDLVRIGARLREVGAALVLDLTQSLGVLPFPLAAVDPDFLVVAGYKWLMAPYSTGFLYVAPRHHEGRPIERSWFARAGSENFGGLIDYPEAYQPGARRFDMGEPSNFGLLPGATAALGMIAAWGVSSVAETVGALTARVVALAADRGLECVPAGLRAAHYASLRAPGGFPADLADRLARERVYASIRGGTVLRVTPQVYNEATEVDRLFAVLDQAS
ncbi:MAG: aminotransferase class V-fold PLP-dependent enzyme [Gemmatimonadales bacterium]